jgi:hypothetical protein
LEYKIQSRTRKNLTLVIFKIRQAVVGGNYNQDNYMDIKIEFSLIHLDDPEAAKTSLNELLAGSHVPEQRLDAPSPLY